MLTDRLLVWRLKHNDPEALRHVYDRYKDELLALAVALLGDKGRAEDILHDVYVSFIERIPELELRGSLKSYLSTAVVNCVRSLIRSGQYRTVELTDQMMGACRAAGPESTAVKAELAQRAGRALMQLPYQQREVILMHLHSGLRFRKIARLLGLSINTVQSRYRYGLNKVRSLLVECTEQ